MNEPEKPTLLDALRQKSEIARAKEIAARKPLEEMHKDIDRVVWRAFCWIEEAVGHLAIIRPSVRHTFQLENMLAIARPRFDRGFVSFRRKLVAGLDLLEHVELLYRLEGSQPAVLRVSPGTAGSVEARLRATTLDFGYHTELDARRSVKYGVFRIQPSISASVRLKPDYHRQVVQVSLSNVDRFESITLEFQPHKLDEPALEDLVKLILGDADGFLRRAPLVLVRGGRDPSQANANALRV